MKRLILAAIAVAALASPAAADYTVRHSDGSVEVTHCDYSPVYGYSCYSHGGGGASARTINVPDDAERSDKPFVCKDCSDLSITPIVGGGGNVLE